MQTRSLRKPVYQFRGIDTRTYSEATYKKYEKLRHFRELTGQGCSVESAVAAIGIKKSTLYRWERQYLTVGMPGLEDLTRRPHRGRQPKDTSATQSKIYEIRKANPLWGKAKIRVILKREHGLEVSESSVGRILKKLVVIGKIRPTSFYRGKIKVKKKRVFDGHAKRWKYGMKAQNPGELIQIDHALIQLPNGGWIRHFEAICPITKIAAQQAYHRATSAIAADFLLYMRRIFPFTISSIQVDGGSEFMGDFEQACFNAQIPLFVLPPKRPQYNGNVERVHSTVKYEFYFQYAGSGVLSTLRKHLEQYNKRYNTYRPHQALQFLTPWCYYQSIAGRPNSHMY